MTRDELKARTRKFTIDVYALCAGLPQRFQTDQLQRQLLRASSSIAANYRSACRARSKPEFISKLGIVEEEADETLFWLELLPDVIAVTGGQMKPGLESELRRLISECDQLLRIIIASKKTARANV